MSERIYYVYAYFRLDGSPCYVGKGKGDRWLHKGKYGRNLHFLRLREQARAQGMDLPRMKIIEGLTDKEALQIERDLILLIGREADSGCLVNLSKGGDGPSGYKWTEEQRRAHGAKRPKNLTPEWRAAISAGMKASEKVTANVAKAGRASRGSKKSSGWWSTEEGRAKQLANNHARLGQPHLAETKQKIRHATIRQMARIAVKTSQKWADMNSVRYPLLAA